MLAPTNRLKNRRLFTHTLRQGKYLPGRFVTLKIQPKNNQLKVGFIVSKKVSPKAVKRNRLKRQLREIFRLAIKDNVLPTDNLIVVIANPGALDKKYTELENDVESIIKNIPPNAS